MVRYELAHSKIADSCGGSRREGERVNIHIDLLDIESDIPNIIIIILIIFNNNVLYLECLHRIAFAFSILSIAEWTAAQIWKMHADEKLNAIFD